MNLQQGIGMYKLLVEVGTLNLGKAQSVTIPFTIFLKMNFTVLTLIINPPFLLKIGRKKAEGNN